MTISKDGPYTVSGNLPLIREEIVYIRSGEPLKWRTTKKYPDQEVYTLCRCGKSRNKPFCDGTHARKHFDGTETATRKPFFEEAEIEEGQGIKLADVESLCSASRFCNRAGGIYNLLEKTDDPEIRQIVTEEACNCASGRLVALDMKRGRPIEPSLEKAVSLVEDPHEGISGPIRLKGGIPLESTDSKRYEIRNRATICRCGHSKNKPFCDTTHVYVRFKSRYRD